MNVYDYNITLTKRAGLCPDQYTISRYGIDIISVDTLRDVAQWFIDNNKKDTLELSPCPYANEVARKTLDRARKGYEKYGVTLARTDLDFDAWLNHFQEELMDAVAYIQRTRDCKLDDAERKELEDLREWKRLVLEVTQEAFPTKSGT